MSYSIAGPFTLSVIFLEGWRLRRLVLDEACRDEHLAKVCLCHWRNNPGFRVTAEQEASPKAVDGRQRVLTFPEIRLRCRDVP